ncbi:MAG: BMP family ABC transporter substrate-binding protein [Candidatus Thorarchaeota archaeon]|nr:BMP family ABC transporter substrate-binding protein [Candidatus Thorarchaeota archaeon]
MSSTSSLITSFIVVTLVFGAVGGYLFVTNPYEPSRVAIVMLEPGRGDLSLMDQMELGLENLSDTVSFSYYWYVVSETNAVSKLQELAGTGGYYDIIVVVGHGLKSALTTVAPQFPDQRFAIIGAEVSGANVVSADFSTEQAAFLAGVLAAHLAAAPNYSKKIGIIGSFEDDTEVTKMVAGFKAGVSAANETYALGVSLLPNDIYLNSYNDTEAARTQTQFMFSVRNASVIFAPVRASIMGVAQAALAVNATWNAGVPASNRRLPLVIGAEGNQDYLGLPDYHLDIGISLIATSVVPHTDYAIATILNATAWDNYPAGQHLKYNLTNDGVSLTSFRYSTQYISTELREIIAYWKALIISLGGLPP